MTFQRTTGCSPCKLSLNHGKLSFSDTERIINKLNLIQKVSMDELYDECTTANSILKGLRDSAEDEWKSKDVAARWVALFQVANMLSIISHILSIPAYTGYVERIFSRMANKWSDSRNRCSVELIRSELLITFSFEQSCSEVYCSCLKDKQILSAARSDKKYTYKRK
ncbi:uncharacterized protein LOC113746684 [Tachysurus ichikawai]